MSNHHVSSSVTSSSTLCPRQVVGSECWAYCAQGYLGDPARYFCVGTAQGTEVVADVLNISCTENVTAGRRLQSACDGVAVQSLGLERMEFVHSCASLPHDEVRCVHLISFITGLKVRHIYEYIMNVYRSSMGYSLYVFFI